MSEAPETRIEVAPENTAVRLIRDAIAADVSPEKLRELLAVRQLWEDNEARKAYSVAVCEFQKRAPIIAKLDDANGRGYARRDRIWAAIRPIMTEVGLSVTFQICELRADGICHIEGQLRHRDGHGERIVQDIPLPDVIRGQNKAQQMGSATEYARRYATCSALGIVTGEDNDGGGSAELVSKEEGADIAAALDKCRRLPGFNEKAFWGWVRVDKIEDIPAAWLGRVLMELKRVIDEGGSKKAAPAADVQVPRDEVVSLRAKFEGRKWEAVKIHFGDYEGVALGELAKDKLFGWLKWQPKPYKGKVSEDDKILRAALDAAEVETAEET